MKVKPLLSTNSVDGWVMTKTKMNYVLHFFYIILISLPESSSELARHGIVENGVDGAVDVHAVLN